MTTQREERARVVVGDCVEAMRELGESSVDAIVTDPPYGLEFMGKEWDRLDVGLPQEAPSSSIRMQRWHEEWAREAYRVLKPGGHLLAFGGTRTYHRLACAVEDAGFEIRDSLIWLYGSGFPKALDVSKAINKAAGAEREIVGRKPVGWGGLHANDRLNDDGWDKIGAEYPDGQPITAPATPEAEKWNGWGTALKPGHEPIVMARKPLIGTVAANVQAHGTGALNIDGCRIGTEGGTKAINHATKGDGRLERWDEGFRGARNEIEELPGLGRWPANVLLDEEAASELDRQAPDTGGGGFPGEKGGIGHGAIYGAPGSGKGLRDTGRVDPNGGASRFFYCAKASQAERNAGLAGFEKKPAGVHDDDAYVWPLNGDGSPRGKKVERRANDHPTVKPVSLMRWLVRLVTPEGGTVLDPFTGSGTTGAAAVLEDVGFIGIEREAEYAELAEARINWWAQHEGREADEVLEETRRSESERERMEAMGQMGLL